MRVPLIPRLRLPTGPFARSLRFRLALSYVIFFAVLLVAVGVLFRQTLATILDDQVRALLSEEWAAIKGYLTIERRKPVWFYARDDPEETAIVKRLRQNFVLTDADGHPLEMSEAYRALGVESLAEIHSVLKDQKAHWAVRRNAAGVPYLIRSGLLTDDRRREYFMAIARPLSENVQVLERFTLNYFAFVPVMILASGILGWFMAGRALRPLNEVARAAQRVSGSNLKLRIPLRNSGDELDHLIKTFNHMVERLEASFEQIRQFSTDVSHELRTPLTAVRGQLEVALFTAKSTEQFREAMVNALEDVERLSQIVRALLLLSQSESGQLHLQKAPVNFSALIEDVVDQFQIPAEAAGVRLAARTPPGCAIEADRVQLERLVSNLLSNAVKYTPAGGEVSVRLERNGANLRLEVRDSGQGIPAESLPHIFERFYRVNPADPSPERGLGLGLSFVAWIAKAHGGKIEVESEVGRGSRFLVTLPAGSAPAPAVEPLE